MNIVTKSDFLLGRTCEYALWAKYSKDFKEELSKSALFRIEQGYEVEKRAVSLFQDIVNAQEMDLKEALLLKKPLYQAQGRTEKFYARFDILEPTQRGVNIIEVKSSTSVKPEHYYDAAFQYYIMQELNIEVENVYILHLNKEYVKNQTPDNELCIREDITSKVLELLEEVKDISNTFYEFINSKTFKETYFFCSSPKNCPLKDEHYTSLPKYSVFELYNGRKKPTELYNSNIITLKDIPSNFKLTPTQTIQVKCAQTNSIHINKNAIKKRFQTLQYPLYYLDFETYATAIPIHDYTRPHQRIPFQFSVHFQQSPHEKEIQHEEYLANSNEDPRREFLEHLQQKIPTDNQGSIIVYNKGFEASVLQELARDFPEFQEYVLALLLRIFDLLDIFKQFEYHNLEQRGSCSIKQVLPALLPKYSYSDLNISNGSDASLEFFNSIFKYTNQTHIDTLREQLLKYCELDTLAMLKIKEKLEELTQ